MTTLREFYKEQFLQEVTRRQTLMGSLNFPLGILTLIVGAQLVVIKSITMPFDMAGRAEMLLIAISVALIIVAGGFLIRCYFGYRYGHMPTTTDLQKYSADLTDRYMRRGMLQADAQSAAESKTLDYIDATFAKLANVNAQNNDRKSRYLFFANGALIGSIVFFVLGAVPYTWNSINAAPPVQKVEVVNLKEGRNDKKAP